tara:strand:- start:1244 stop:2140 length:897 start_codon:yes stop_codon:yes gene_type:complete
MSSPLVSVLINCYNGEKYVEAAIDSVIDQTYKNWEIIFWDNQSTDNSEKILKKYNDERINYFRSEEHTTQYEARNNGLKKCSGDLIAFLDVDDFWQIKKLEKQVEVFNNNKIGFSCTNAWIINERRKNQKKLAFEKIFSGHVLNELLVRDFITMSSLMIKKSIMNDYDLSFNSKYEIIGDFDLVIQLAKVTLLGGINEPLTYYRLHQDNLTYKKTKLNSIELLNILKKYENDPNILNSSNFLIFSDNVIFYKCIVSILEGNRLSALKNIGKLKNLYHKIKLILTLFLPNNLILYLRNR